MDTERLRNLAAAYGSRAEVTEVEVARNCAIGMASHLESIVAWIEAGQGVKAADSIAAPPNSARDNRGGS